MPNPINICPLNDKGQPHGRWEIYYNNGKLDNIATYYNGEANGYCESYWSSNNKIHYKGFLKKNKAIGFSYYSDYSNSNVKKQYCINF